jgi:hypothetical protein
MTDTSPGTGASSALNRYWLTGEGLAKWATSPTPYRTLLALLLKYMSSDKAHGLAAEYYHEHFGKWPGHQ